MRRAFGVSRLLVALLGSVALIFDFDYVLGFSTFSTTNYFSYFTFQSNLANVVMLGSSGVLLLRGHVVGRMLVSVRALITTYVIVSGIVFGTIVSQAGSHQYRIEVPWSSVVLHFVIPAYLVADWLIGVGRTRLRWRTVAIVLVFPVIWGIFTLIRGAEVGWYPYFFLDPSQVTPLEFVMYCGIAIALFAGVMAGAVATSRLRAARWASGSPSANPVPSATRSPRASRRRTAEGSAAPRR